MFGITIKNTPVFNTPNLKDLFHKRVLWDCKGHVRFLETIFFPNTTLNVISSMGNVLEIQASNYPAKNALFVDRRFVFLSQQRPSDRLHKVFSKETVLQRLLAFQNHPYLLGGTLLEPIFDWALYYPPPKGLDPFSLRHRIFWGVDCSGILHYATDGYLPRNTSWLYEFGDDVSDIQALDMIVWPGHVLIALGEKYVIESREFDGTVITKWSERKKEIRGCPYRIKRWYHRYSSSLSAFSNRDSKISSHL